MLDIDFKNILKCLNYLYCSIEEIVFKDINVKIIKKFTLT